MIKKKTILYILERCFRESLFIRRAGLLSVREFLDC